LTGAEPNGDTYMSSRLKALDAQQIIQANFRKGHGNTKFIEVANDVELIIDNLFPQDFNNIIAKNYCDIESIIVNRLKKGSNGSTC
jgi:DNA-binding transcriptional regulator GbsR (MarR family)